MGKNRLASGPFAAVCCLGAPFRPATRSEARGTRFNDSCVAFPNTRAHDSWQEADGHRIVGATLGLPRAQLVPTARRGSLYYCSQDRRLRTRSGPPPASDSIAFHLCHSAGGLTVSSTTFLCVRVRGDRDVCTLISSAYRSSALLLAPIMRTPALAACCGFDLCNKYILYLHLHRRPRCRPRAAPARAMRPPRRTGSPPPRRPPRHAACAAAMSAAAAESCGRIRGGAGAGDG
jgi:hypothetical protein